MEREQMVQVEIRRTGCKAATHPRASWSLSSDLAFRTPSGTSLKASSKQMVPVEIRRASCKAATHLRAS